MKHYTSFLLASYVCRSALYRQVLLPEPFRKPPRASVHRLPKSNSQGESDSETFAVVMMISCLNVVDPFEVARSSARCICFRDGTNLVHEWRPNFCQAPFCLVVRRPQERGVRWHRPPGLIWAQRTRARVRRPLRPGKVSVLLTALLCLVVRCLQEQRPRWAMRRGQFLAQRARKLPAVCPVPCGLRGRRPPKRRRALRSHTHAGARPT